ncbi:protein of unknown function [Streptantibioticus cattleyicolor NRRL 8057 = DSM 46488]|nr:protein of unknown function [Streptantibioticus cattleyicolor NRRL 8057 = DSM 46488]
MPEAHVPIPRNDTTALTKTLYFGVDPKKPGVPRTVNVREIEPGIAVAATLGSVDFGYTWGLLTGRSNAGLDEHERALGRKILTQPRFPWQTGDQPGNDGFGNYVTRLIGSLKQTSKGRSNDRNCGDGRGAWAAISFPGAVSCRPRACCCGPTSFSPTSSTARSGSSPGPATTARWTYRSPGSRGSTARCGPRSRRRSRSGRRRRCATSSPVSTTSECSARSRSGRRRS